MKVSKYTLTVEDFPREGRYLLFNTKTQAFIVVRDPLKKWLEDLRAQRTPCETPGAATVEKLKELGMLVPSGLNENEALKAWFEEIRFDAGRLELYVLTTLDCNFACPYCYEGKDKPKTHLSMSKVTAFADWIEAKADQRNAKHVEVHFFGGEPLLNIPALEALVHQLHALSKTKPWDFEFSIITNGALVTPELVERLNPFGLRSIRITVDGDREFHDQYRPFVGGHGSFDLIMRNIKAVADKTKVAIAGNFNAESYESLYRLLDYLEAEGLRDKIAMIDFKPITETREPALVHQVSSPTYLSDPGHAQKMTAVKRELVRRGFKTSEPLGVSGLCYFKTGDHQLAIDPEGKIYKCPAMIGQENKVCGEVSEISLNKRYAEFTSTELGDLDGKCGDCPYLPLCAGGCNYHAELQTGSYRNLFCQKRFFDETIDELIKIKYEMATGVSAQVETGASASGRPTASAHRGGGIFNHS